MFRSSKDLSNPAHRIMAVLGCPFGWSSNGPAKGIEKRRKARKASRASRRFNLRRR